MHGKRIAVVAALCLAVGSATAQASTAPKFRGRWQPVVGSGAVYRVEAKDHERATWQIAVVGKQSDDAYWLETSEPVQGGESITKYLVGPKGIEQMVKKTPWQPAMQMPKSSVPADALPGTDLDAAGKLLGEETIELPAGSFSCRHYRLIEDGQPVDVWISMDVAPYGLVKWAASDTAITLQRVIAQAATQVTEQAQPSDVPMPPPGTPIKDHSH